MFQDQISHKQYYIQGKKKKTVYTDASNEKSIVNDQVICITTVSWGLACVKSCVCYKTILVKFLEMVPVHSLHSYVVGPAKG